MPFIKKKRDDRRSDGSEPRDRAKSGAHRKREQMHAAADEFAHAVATSLIEEARPIQELIEVANRYRPKDKTKKMDIEIAPLRSIDDFLFNSARFQIPNFKDPDKWMKRVIRNLLYYQTNYFFLAVVIFLIVGVLHPLQVCYALGAMGTMSGLFYFITSQGALATQLTREHPLLCVLVLLVGYSPIIYLLDAVLVFCFGICLPVIVVLIHASLRLRNLMNKLTNKLDALAMKRTPMALFLDELGVENDKIVS